ncbi:hypothetical protein PDE_05149 [Penicillium oxalicum 114-2]|uniref:Ysc84 actin-binding domain-containing protein n=1 Tax=Penicillium oxalicum (strain 114-2 / CGMCC 5302) TaxID=933388 RepID=S7ZIU0_PENO1|nr:hypothetical protein PDE_05149 [Penicillium oxalicum 114-2]
MASTGVGSQNESPASTEATPANTASTTTSNARQTPIAGRRTPIHNPFPASLASECKKAAQIIDSFVNPRYEGLEGTIPQRIIAPAKGLVICSVFKAGFLGSVRFGSGLIVCRLPNGNWSAPSAISLGGLGAGGQFGMEFTNFVFVLNTDSAVNTFIHSGTLTLGGNISIAFGTGRSAEAAAMLGTKGVSNIFAYSKTRGVYGGLTVEGGVITERSSTNKTLYKRKVKVKDLLTGEIPPPPQAEPLMRILNSDCFRPPTLNAEPSPSVAAPEAEVTGALPSSEPVELVVEPSARPNEPNETEATQVPVVAEQSIESAEQARTSTADDEPTAQQPPITVSSARTGPLSSAVVSEETQESSQAAQTAENKGVEVPQPSKSASNDRTDTHLSALMTENATQPEEEVGHGGDHKKESGTQ